MSEQTEVIFPKGMMIKKRKPDSQPPPDWVKAEFSFKCSEFAEFMNEHASNDWINITLKESQKGNLYLALDTWKPTEGDIGKQGIAKAKQAAEPDPFEDSDIPFSNYEYRTLV